MIFEVQGTGELLEVEDTDFEPQQDSAYILVSSHDKLCYLWFGEKSGPREKFVAANEARKMKLDTTYNTINVQHDEREEEFNLALEKWREYKNQPSQSSQVGLDQFKQMLNQDIKGDTFIKSETPVTSPYQRTRGATGLVTKTFKFDKKDIPDDNQISAIITKLSTLEPIEGHIRDYIITAGHVYSTTLVNNEVVVNLLDEVKDGVFMVDQYKSRFYIEDSSLIAIEMWRIPK